VREGIVTTLTPDRFGPTLVDLPEQRSTLPVPGVELVPAGVRGPNWERWYIALVMALDLVAVLLGGLLALQVRFGRVNEQVQGMSYLFLVVGAAIPWVAMMAASRAYEPRFLGLGSEEFRRVANAAVRFTALVAVLAYAFDVGLARGMVAVALPVAAAMTLLLRYGARRLLHRVRRTGTACHRVLLVGEGPELATLERRLESSPHAGLRVVGRCSPRGRGALSDVREAIEKAQDSLLFGGASPQEALDQAQQEIDEALELYNSF
jgi:hypothetical protein